MTDWRWRPGSVSVVIPTYNRADVLLRVLAGFERQTLAPDRFEVIVVDDGSTDDTTARLNAYHAACPYALHCLSQPNGGPAAARNRGLDAAGGEVVVFVDDDCVPDSRLLDEHLASHEVEGLGVIGRIVTHPDIPTTPLTRFVDERVFAYRNIDLPFDASFVCFYTGNASVQRASALAIGGFDAAFPRAAYEDIDFAYRLRRHGVRLVFNDRARVLHDQAPELASLLRRSRVMGREIVRLWAKHPELRDLVPVDQLVDPAARDRLYQALVTHAVLLGVEEGVTDAPAIDPTGQLRDLFAGEQQRRLDERVDTLYDELRGARAERDRLQARRQDDLAELDRLRDRQARLDAEHARLQAAYREQAAWATGLERDVRVLRARPLTRLAGWLARRAGRR